MDNHSDARRHMVISDPQVKPGGSIKHLGWAAQAVVEYKPDVLVLIGDWWDLPSLSKHEPIGSMHLEGSRLQADIDAGNEAMRYFCEPIERERDRLVKGKRKHWDLDAHITFGNHEWRLQRTISADPKMDGVLTIDALKTPAWIKRHPFLEIVQIDGIKYCHYFANPLSGKPIGGTIHNRLGHIGSSFVQGHQQGFLYASKQYPDHVKHGVVCGRFYKEHEHYRPDDVQRSEWNGIVVLNQVHDGDFDIMPLRYDYLERKYG